MAGKNELSYKTVINVTQEAIAVSVNDVLLFVQDHEDYFLEWLSERNMGTDLTDANVEYAFPAVTD